MALETLPASLSRNLPALKELAVNTNSLTALPDGVGQLRALQSLVVRHNLLETLPEFAPLPVLATLDCSSNHLSALPESIGNLQHLQTLDVNSNELSQLPASLCTLRALRSLCVHTNQIVVLPDDLGSLPALTSLDAASNRLAALPHNLGYLAKLTALDVSRNALLELPPSIGSLRCLQKLYAASNPRLAALPALAGLQSIRLVDVTGCALAELPSITELHALRELKIAGNPLQRPPASVAGRGLDAIRRYFVELESEGATTSRAARLVLLGDGMAGKTSLQRGLRAGCTPSPTAVDARTIQLDISELVLFDDHPTHEPVTFSVWDLGGQVAYAAAQQPYIAPGSLYIVCVAAPRANDEHFAEVIGRWLCYLQAGAPAAYVVIVLTQCDQLLPAGATDRSPAALEAAAAEQAWWVRRCIYWHQCRLGRGATRLRFHDDVVCVSSVSGGEASLRRLKSILETIATSKPPLLLSIGQTIPRTWSYAVSMLRAIRDGAEPVAMARAVALQLDANDRTPPSSGGAPPPSGAAAKKALASAAPAAPLITMPTCYASLARPYITTAEAAQRWVNVVAPALRVGADSRVLYDALQLLVNQGEVFSSCGCVYLQPAHVTSLLKPLVDHRLDRDWAIPRAYEHTGEPYESSPSVQLLLAAVGVLRASGEMREELLPMLWEDVDLHHDDYASVLLMLSESGVLFLSEHTALGRRWVMPMRLPESPPARLEDEWSALPERGQLRLRYPLRLAPPGLVERLMAACYDLGYYHQFWRRGALIRARAVDGSAMLLELRNVLTSEHDTEASDYPTPPPMTAGSPIIDGESAPPLHHLLCEFRGPLEVHEQLIELLVQVRMRADRLLRDFPGLGDVDGEVHGVNPTSLSAFGAAATEGGGESGTRSSALLLALAAADAPIVATAAAAMQTPLKYLGQLKYGRPIEAGMGLHRLLGVGSADELRQLRMRGEEEILKEVGRYGLRAGKDAMGWGDHDWLTYVHTQSAEERVLPHGMPCALLDRGHAGMRLDDFVRHPLAIAAGLKRSHVLALRLYSCSVYRTINTHLRDGCSEERRHPYPACVGLLCEAIQLLRKARAERLTTDGGSKRNGAGSSNGVGGGEGSSVLWHGVAGMAVSAEFLVRGGTSMGVLSATPDRGVAERYASRAGLASAALLLKLRLPDLAKHGGAPIAFLSAFPEEEEVVYNPGTYLRPMGAPKVLVSAGVAPAGGARPGEVMLAVRLYHVMEVVPMPVSGAA